MKKILHFFLTKIIIGTAALTAPVIFIEWGGRALLDRTACSNDLKDLLIAAANSAIAITVYVLVFSVYEKRRVTELAFTGFLRNSSLGFFTGLILQSLIILLLFFAGGYFLVQVNPASSLLPGFAAALAAGFVGETILRGILFRLLEEKLGTMIALAIITLLFVVMHVGVKGATLLYLSSTAIQAGILISSIYIYTRSLWSAIFLHFAWDLAEPGIYGGINPGITVGKTLFSSRITGTTLLTGEPFGPVHSIQSAVFCFLAGLLFLVLAKNKGRLILPYWKAR